jgi:hypothetical protein
MPKQPNPMGNQVAAVSTIPARTDETKAKQQNIMIFTQLWPQCTAADVGMCGFSQGPGNPGNVMIYAAKIGHIDPVQIFFPVSESCCEGTPGRLTVDHVVGEQRCPRAALEEGSAQECVDLTENKLSFNKQVFFRIIFCFGSLMWDLFCVCVLYHTAKWILAETLVLRTAAEQEFWTVNIR